MRNTAEAFHSWLENGGSHFGEILITRLTHAWDLRHHADADSSDLELHTEPDDARNLANLTSAGAYRPLKTAPSLRRGWHFQLSDPDAVRTALSHFYPAMIGIWLAHASRELQTTHLRDTLLRQTGMYRVTQKITDSQAQQLIARFCNSTHGCLKTILWKIDPSQPVTTLPESKFTLVSSRSDFPLLCHEPCNLLVAEARNIVKRESAPMEERVP